jgi:hypothetical protein
MALGSLYVYQSGAPWILSNNPNEVYLKSAYVKPHIQKDDDFIRLAAPCADSRFRSNHPTCIQSPFLLALVVYSHGVTGGLPNESTRDIMF